MGELRRATPVPLGSVDVNDRFWSEYIDLIRTTVIPYQWDALNDRIPDAPPSHAVKNFRIAAGLEEGSFGGLVFQDSDVAKWLEAVAYVLQKHHDPELERTADEMIDLIVKAQQPDGYLDTYFIIKAPHRRWQNLNECHELYCAGHMIEAAVAYYKATGKRTLLDAACRLADHIDSIFGKEDGKRTGYSGHPEIELALVKLYRTTGNVRYLELSRYFVDERGQEPNFFLHEWEGSRHKISEWSGREVPPPNLAYCQAHAPVRDQDVAVGHAVRAVYLYSGMADIAAETGDERLLQSCRRLWSNIVERQMYITGGIGSTHHGEAFTFDYDLPNDTVYAETCAAIGLIFFAHRMLQIEADSGYSDVMERALYNNVLAAMSKDGRSFFYVNPLEVWPDASQRNPGKHHVKPVRQRWFGCACCPPNIARLLASLGEYIYSVKDRTLYVHLYIGGQAEAELDGEKIGLKQEGGYPWDGSVSLTLRCPSPSNFGVALRIPGWCRSFEVRVNGESVDLSGRIVKGYAVIERLWRDDDRIELTMEMPVEVIESNPQVRADAGKVAVQRGPIVYCLEEADNGRNLSALSILTDSPMIARYDENLLGGAVIITGEAERIDESGWGRELYRPYKRSSVRCEFRAVPYYLWGNRKPGEMQVWTRRG